MKWKKMSRFGMKLALGQIKGPKRLLAFDIGSLSTGVAISCPYLQKAYLLKVITCPIDSPQYPPKLSKLLNDHQPHSIIIGKPILAQKTNKINSKIDELVVLMQRKSRDTQQQIMYCFQDEDWSTKEAKGRIRQIKRAIEVHGHLHGEKQLEDGLAAMNILERYLRYYNQRQSQFS